jgi:hypothetical protein
VEHDRGRGVEPDFGGSTVALDAIYEERDKELFLAGARLPDQRRFDRWADPNLNPA